MKSLNNLNKNDLAAALTRCCGSAIWVDGMLAQRPYCSAQDLHEKAKQVYATLETADYLEAFSHHPRIGGDLAKLREKFALTADWSGNEQSSVKQASEAVLRRLAAGNDAYYKNFGYIFIVCATGKSAHEMLDLLEARLPNDPADEIKIAAGEQEKIMGLRLDKLLTEIGTEIETEEAQSRHFDPEHHFSFQFPEKSPTGQTIAVEKNQTDSFHRIHVYSEEDMQEVYFEVRSYSSMIDHAQNIDELKQFLTQMSSEGKISDTSQATLRSFQTSEFGFEGPLQGFYKIRRFILFDNGERTFRIAYDPRSAVNEYILDSFQLEFL